MHGFSGPTREAYTVKKKYISADNSNFYNARTFLMSLGIGVTSTAASSNSNIEGVWLGREDKDIGITIKIEKCPYNTERCRDADEIRYLAEEILYGGFV